MNRCEVCGIEWGYRNACESPSCPVFGLVPGTDEAETAVERWRSRGSVAQARCMSGDAALSALERQSWLEMTEARGAVIDVLIEHRSA